MRLAGPSLGRELRARALSHTAPVPSGEERTPDASAQVERAALGYASAASAAHSWVYRACIAEAAASEALGLSVGGCIRAWRDFGPYPVKYVGRNLRTVRICKLRLTVRILVILNLHSLWTLLRTYPTCLQTS